MICFKKEELQNAFNDLEQFRRNGVIANGVSPHSRLEIQIRNLDYTETRCHVYEHEILPRSVTVCRPA
jgi:hypothetical protein